MLINVSNFSLKHWEEKQIDSAKNLWGGIVDYAIPEIPPNAGMEELSKISYDIIEGIRSTLLQSLLKQTCFEDVPAPAVLLICKPELFSILANRLIHLGIPVFYPEAEQIVFGKNYADVSGFIEFKPYAEVSKYAWKTTIRGWTITDAEMEKWIDLCPYQ